MLSEADFKATMGHPMRRIEEEKPLPPDFWSYFEAIDRRDLGRFGFESGTIALAYADPTGTYDHVLLAAEDASDVFLVLVVEPARRRVLGHYLLDLPAVYGLR